MRVVNIVGFRRGYQYLNELLRLAQPFGKVVKHLVLDLRPEVHQNSLTVFKIFKIRDEFRKSVKLGRAPFSHL